jgi:YD repeat-containing protein
VLRQISYDDGSETWETDTAYGGSYVTVTPPAGGTPETTWTNGEGEKTAIWQYHAGAPVSTSDPASDYDTTTYTYTYTYTPAQNLATITDAAGNQWSYEVRVQHDRRGHLVLHPCAEPLGEPPGGPPSAADHHQGYRAVQHRPVDRLVDVTAAYLARVVAPLDLHDDHLHGGLVAVPADQH